MLTPEQQKEMAFQAKIIAENPAFQKAFETVKKVYVDKLIATNHDEASQREYFHICINALEDVKNVLELYLQNGKVLEKELKKKARKYK